jgi:hypothetical protein
MQRRIKGLALFMGGLLFVAFSGRAVPGGMWVLGGSQALGQTKKDPVAWGGNHVGKPLPDYLRGDECLFCHRDDIGPAWPKNPHGITVRNRDDAPELNALLKSQPALEPVAPRIELFMGGRHRVRFLAKQGYGRVEILSTQAVLDANHKAERWIDLDKPAWDKNKFGDRCAGCHTTAIDSSTKQFAGVGLDCYVCHGDVNRDHTKDTSLILFSRKHKRDPLVITSICAQCHIRTGRSKSTGLPYPNNFIAGDNLFQDFEVDLSKADDPSLNPGDRHVLRNVRDVVLYGEESPTCITCHQVHADSTAKHRFPARGAICADCHEREGTIKGSTPYAVKSPLCEY